MTAMSTGDVYYDPYDASIVRDPYPTYRRLRDEAPIYYNEPHAFFAISRYADVERSLADRSTFLSSRGNILEVIKSGAEIPSGVVIFEDPPVHTIHRGLMSRVFTPRKVAALEPRIRAFSASCLDPLVGVERFDVITEFAAEMTMQVIGMLLGIPEADQRAIRDKNDATLRTEGSKAMKVDGARMVRGGAFGEYIDWRMEHPSDDIMTDLLHAEFEDESGARRRLTRQEILSYLQVIAGAGNETTARLICWTVQVLADHPGQRRELVDDRSLIPDAIEEILRYETPGPHIARYVSTDVEFHGRTVPAGSAVLILIAAANRDDRRYSDPNRFDIHRKVGMQMTFGHGGHFCLGAALARIEGRIALEELLARFPDWDVDLDNAKLASTSTVRGWERLPIVVR